MTARAAPFSVATGWKATQAGRTGRNDRLHGYHGSRSVGRYQLGKNNAHSNELRWVAVKADPSRVNEWLEASLNYAVQLFRWREEAPAISAKEVAIKVPGKLSLGSSLWLHR